MKTTKEIIGLPIISINTGNEVGKVKNIIINAERGSIDYVLVDSGVQILNARVILSKNILGIGEYALTIESEEVIHDTKEIPEAIALIQKNIQVKGTKVLTKKGRLIGEVGDIFVDEDRNCYIVGVEYISDIIQKKIRIIPRSQVITFGENLLVVSEDVESHLIDSRGELAEIEGVSDYNHEDFISENINSSNFDNSYKDILESNEIKDEKMDSDTAKIDFNTEDLSIGDDFELNESEDVEIEDEGEFLSNEESKQVETETKKTSAAKLFEEKQSQYIKGKKVTKNMENDLGEVIIEKGTLITEDIIEIAKKNEKMVELVMNNE